MIIISANKSQIFSEDPRIDLTAECKKALNIPDKDASGNPIPIPKDMGLKWLEERNRIADRALLDNVERTGYSYQQSYGGYHSQTDNVTDSYEPTYIVYAFYRDGSPVKWEDLYRFALDMCRKYKQDSVYIQAPGEAPNHVDMDGNIVNSSSTKNFKVNRDQETYYTTNKKKRRGIPQRFTADIRYD
ncbi:MAG: hypothetical protein LUD72_00745 [Bacteroidales bacterium]|nr:hypothetical protein [Bacteroidales bacterium]